jgi:hypothetical protein
MLNWLKTYWPVAILVLLMLVVIDGTLSSLLTCHPISANPSGGADTKPSQEECTALNGPLLVMLTWLLDGLHKYDGVVTGIFTIVLAIFTARLWFSTEKLSESTKQLVEGAEDTAQRQLRAYVHTIGKDFLVQGVEHETFVHRLSVLNAGQTPAYKLQIDSVTKILQHPLPANFAFAFVPEGRNRSMMMIGPKRRVGHDSLADTILSDAELISIMRTDSGVRLYSFGTIKYEDCFRKPRFTNFCYFLEWEVTSEGYSFSVHPTEQHNDAD